MPQSGSRSGWWGVLKLHSDLLKGLFEFLTQWV